MIRNTKIFFQYVIPSILAFALSGIYSIVDGFFVGNQVGDAGLSAINVAYPIVALIQAAGTGIGMGGAVCYSSHNHHFKWWFGLALIRAGYMLAQKGGYRKRCYWSAYKAVLLESSFLDSSACSLIYFFIASSVILPIVET